MVDVSPDVECHVMLKSEDPDLDPVWGLLKGSATITESDDHESGHRSPTSGAEEFPLAECVKGDVCFESEGTRERGNQKELAISIISSGPWQRIGRFPFTLSASKEASILCMTAMTFGDKLRAQLYDEDWIDLNCVASGVSQTSKLLSCIKESGHGWSVCFDVKTLPEESSVSYVLRFVRVAKSHVAMPELDKENCQSSTVPSSSNMVECLDCTDTDASSKMFSAISPPTSMHDVLQRLALLDDADLPAWMLQPDFWISMSRGANVQGQAQQGWVDIPRAELEQASSTLQQSGYIRLQGLAWENIGISLQAVAATMESLSHSGFPPVFIFMYDEPWMLFAELFKVAAEILGCNAVEMDTSVFAWALRPVGEHGAVGNNFGRPHRDCTYNACHTANGDVSALSVWMPVVPATIDNGCMYIVPSEHDPLFDKSGDSRHMCPDQHMPWAFIQPLRCSAGDVLMWPGNLIHWGSACNKNVLRPRKSIGANFRLPCKSSNTHTGKTDTLSHAVLEAGLSMQVRLKIIIASLLGYEHWHPGFAGFSGLKDLFG